MEGNIQVNTSRVLLRALDMPRSANHIVAYAHKDPTLPFVIQFAQRRNKTEFEAQTRASGKGTSCDGATSYHDSTEGGEDFDWADDD